MSDRLVMVFCISPSRDSARPMSVRLVSVYVRCLFDSWQCTSEVSPSSDGDPCQSVSWQCTSDVSPSHDSVRPMSVRLVTVYVRYQSVSWLCTSDVSPSRDSVRPMSVRLVMVTHVSPFSGVPCQAIYWFQNSHESSLFTSFDFSQYPVTSVKCPLPILTLLFGIHQ